MKQPLNKQFHRMQKLAGIITENKVKLDEYGLEHDPNLMSDTDNDGDIDIDDAQNLSTQQIEKKAFDFANSPEMGKLVDKILAKAKTKPQDIEQIKKAVSLVSEEIISESDFSSFLNIAHKAQDKLTEDKVNDLQDSIGKALSTFGAVNIMSMGMLPTLTAAAISYFGGPNFIKIVGDAIGSSSAVVILSVIGSLIGGGLIWRIGKAISGEYVDDNTELFEKSVNEALRKYRKNK